MRHLLAIASALLLTAPVHASTVLDFGTGPAFLHGSIVASGGNVTGANIPVDAFGVNGAPANNGSYDTTGAVANPNDSESGSSAVLSFDTATGKVEITGGIPALGIPDGSTLLKGVIDVFHLAFPNASILSFDASGFDIKDAGLMAVLGLAPNTKWQLFAFTLGAQLGDEGYQAVSTDATNTAMATPEPASLVLLLLGVGCVAVTRGLRRGVMA